MGLDRNKIEEQLSKLKGLQENICAILWALEENGQRMKTILDILQTDSRIFSGMWKELIEECTRNIYEIEHMQAKYKEYQNRIKEYLCFLEGEDFTKSQSTHAIMCRPALPPEEIADLFELTSTPEEVDDLLKLTLPPEKADNLPELTLPSDEKNIPDPVEGAQVADMLRNVNQERK